MNEIERKNERTKYNDQLLVKRRILSHNPYNIYTKRQSISHSINLSIKKRSKQVSIFKERIKLIGKKVIIGTSMLGVGIGIITSSAELSINDEKKVTISNTKSVAKAKTPKIKKTSKSGKSYRVTSTAYTPYCYGCTGRSASGVNLRKSIYYKGMRIIAADRYLFPIGTVLKVKGIGKAVVLDTGGAMHGKILDVLFKKKRSALNYGRKYNVKVTVLGKISVH